MEYDQDPDGPVPELEELQQQPVLDPIVTCVEGTVRTYVLPSRSGASRSYTTGNTGEPVPLLGQDLRRRRAVIIAAEDSIYIGTRDDCMNGTAAIWPPGVPLIIEHTEQIYVRALTDSATVSVIAENWAD